MKQATRNEYSKGINRDINKHQPQQNTLYNSENFRIITQEGLSTMALENVKGNVEIKDTDDLQLQVPSDEKIIGHYVFDDKDIVLFSVNRSSINDYPTHSRIYLYKYNKDTDKYYPRITLYQDDSNNTYQGLRLRDDIRCIGRTETNYIKKIYWVDGINSLRHLNIAPDIDDATGEPYDGTLETHYTRIHNQEYWEFDIIGNYSFSNTTFSFVDFGSGNLASGTYQYAVRLFNKNGNYSNYNIFSELIPLPQTLSNYSNLIKGAQPNIDSFKSIKFKIQDHVSSKYDYVEVYSIQYYDLNTPVVKLINYYDAKKLIDGITIEDNGTYIGESSIDELNTIKTNYIPKTVERKDDRLFIGNITEDYFDVEYDARAYRFPIDSQNTVIRSNDYTTQYIINNNTMITVPEDYDCVNPFNDLNLQNNSNSIYQEYKYKYNSDTLGGTGVNVNYNFIVDEYSLHDKNLNDKNMFVINVDSYSMSSSTIKNYLGIYKGFQRDEIYRFGVVFYDNKGRRSFVKWIGDIRMPSEIEEPIITNDNGDIKGRRLTLEFHINNRPENLDGSVMDYQIVYVPRTFKDRTVVSTGYLNNMIVPPFDGNTTAESAIRIFKSAPTSFIISDASPTVNIHEFISADLDMNNFDLNETYVQMTNKCLNPLLSYSKLRDNSTDTYLYISQSFDHLIQNFPDNFNKLKTVMVLSTNDDFKPGVGVVDKVNATKSPYYSPHTYSFTKSKVAPIATRFSGESECKDGTIFKAINNEYMNMIRPIVIQSDNTITLNQYSVYSYIRRITKGYGGFSYNDRSLNEYIACGSINNSIPDYGDTLINYYDKQRQTLTRTFADRKGWFSRNWDWGSILATNRDSSPDGGASDKTAQSSGFSLNLQLPLETSINLPYIHGFQAKRYMGESNIRFVTDSQNRFNINETVYGDQHFNEKIFGGSVIAGATVTSWGLSAIGVGVGAAIWPIAAIWAISEAVYVGDDEVSNESVSLLYPDMFQYNPVYSKLNDVILYSIKPFYWNRLVNFPTRIRYSDIKFNGELYDKWLEFKPNNMQDVDSEFGEIEQLVNWKNYLFAFQHRGFCMLPVNERAATTTTEGTPVVLGEGSVLPKFFNYSQGSEKYGLQNGNQVKTTSHGIYWIDTIEKKALVFNGQLMELNIITGMSSWINENITENTKYYTGYDNQYKEVLFSFNDDVEAYKHTLVFNEIINSFQGFYTYTTNRYIEIPELLSVSDKRLIWQHNIGIRGSWYDYINASLMEIIINDQTGVTKEFNNIEYLSESFTEDTKVDNYQDTFNYIKADNDFLSSELIELLPFLPADTLYTGGLPIPNTAPDYIKNIRRRERMWRTVVPRVASGNVDIDDYRMRDAYVKLKLIYNNDNGYQFIMHPLTTYYTLSNIE